MTYLSVLNSEQWSLDRATLMARLAEDWPGIEVRGVSSDGPLRSLGEFDETAACGAACRRLAPRAGAGRIGRIGCSVAFR